MFLEAMRILMREKEQDIRDYFFNQESRQHSLVPVLHALEIKQASLELRIALYRLKLKRLKLFPDERTLLENEVAALKTDSLNKAQERLTTKIRETVINQENLTIGRQWVDDVDDKEHLAFLTRQALEAYDTEFNYWIYEAHAFLNNEPDEFQLPSELRNIKQSIAKLKKSLEETISQIHSVHTNLNPISLDQELALIRIESRLSQTCLHAYCETGNLEKIMALFNDINDDTVFGNDQYAHLSLSEKRKLLANLNVNGFLPLHVASAAGHQHIVSYLIDQGANITQRDNNDKTAKDYAVQYGHRLSYAPNVSSQSYGRMKKADSKVFCDISLEDAPVKSIKKSVTEEEPVTPMPIGALWYDYFFPTPIRSDESMITPFATPEKSKETHAPHTYSFIELLWMTLGLMPVPNNSDNLVKNSDFRIPDTTKTVESMASTCFEEEEEQHNSENTYSHILRGMATPPSPCDRVPFVIH